MILIETEIGWEDEYGYLIGVKEEWDIINCGRHPNFRTHVFKELKG